MDQDRSPMVPIVRIVLFAGASAGFVAMVTMAGRLSAGLFIFVVLMLFPFGLVFWAIHKRSLSMTGLLWLLAGSGISLAAYVSAIWPSAHVSSTAGVALGIIPIAQTLWCLPAIVFSRGRPQVESP